MTKKPKMKVMPDGTREWRLHGRLHRTDGPAIERANGQHEWWLNNLRHRTDGPAIESSDGIRSWWQHDKLHREDGPAVEYPDGTREWRLHFKELTFEQWLAQTPAAPAEKTMLALRWR